MYLFCPKKLILPGGYPNSASLIHVAENGHYQAIRLQVALSARFGPKSRLRQAAGAQPTHIPAGFVRGTCGGDGWRNVVNTLYDIEIERPAQRTLKHPPKTS
jgi:hypothetical protein